jgi:hypothetical protein
VAADQAFRGAIIGGLAGLGCLLLQGLLMSSPPHARHREREDRRGYDE